MFNRAGFNRTSFNRSAQMAKVWAGNTTVDAATHATLSVVVVPASEVAATISGGVSSPYVVVHSTQGVVSLDAVPRAQTNYEISYVGGLRTDTVIDTYYTFGLEPLRIIAGLVPSNITSSALLQVAASIQDTTQPTAQGFGSSIQTFSPPVFNGSIWAMGTPSNSPYVSTVLLQGSVPVFGRGQADTGIAATLVNHDTMPFVQGVLRGAHALTLFPSVQGVVVLSERSSSVSFGTSLQGSITGIVVVSFERGPGTPFKSLVVGEQQTHRYPKQPQEERTILIDFSECWEMRAGETISGVQVTAPTGGLNLAHAVSGNRVLVRISGGKSGENNLVLVAATTNSGSRIKFSILVAVREELALSNPTLLDRSPTIIAPDTLSLGEPFEDFVVGDQYVCQYIKAPAETRTLKLDYQWCGEIQAGESIVSARVSVSSGAVVVNYWVSNNAVFVRMSGGEIGEDCIVSVLAVTNFGHLIESDVLVSTRSALALTHPMLIGGITTIIAPSATPLGMPFDSLMASEQGDYEYVKPPAEVRTLKIDYQQCGEIIAGEFIQTARVAVSAGTVSVNYWIENNAVFVRMSGGEIGEDCIVSVLASTNSGNKIEANILVSTRDALALTHPMLTSGATTPVFPTIVPLGAPFESFVVGDRNIYEYIKPPIETRTLKLDYQWCGEIKAGEIIQGARVTVSAGTVIVNYWVANNAVFVRMAGGELGEDCIISVLAMTNSGHLIESGIFVSVWGE